MNGTHWGPDDRVALLGLCVMTTRFKMKVGVLFATAGVIALLCFFYVRTHPLVFNESFLEHAHCIVGGGLSLDAYASEHEGRFPFSTNGYGDALVLVNAGWDESLTGPGYDARVFDRVRRTGENAPENEFGRVYVQGLSNTDNPEIVLLFDKLPTPGGDHCHLLSRLFAPLGREVWTIGEGHRFVPEKDWPAFSKHQIELLVAAAVSKELAEMYYSEKAEPRVPSDSHKITRMMDATNETDAEVRKKLPGNWIMKWANSTGSFQSTWTIFPNASYVCRVIASNFSDGIMRTQDMGGRVKFTNGVLVDMTTRHSQTNAQLPMISRLRIVRLDDREMVLNEWSSDTGELLTNEYVYRREKK